jgi:hypothetical protein
VRVIVVISIERAEGRQLLQNAAGTDSTGRRGPAGRSSQRLRAYADGVVESGDGSVLQVFLVPNAGASKPEIWEDDRNRFFIFFDDKGAVVAASKATHVRRYPKSEWLVKVRQMLRSILY